MVLSFPRVPLMNLKRWILVSLGADILLTLYQNLELSQAFVHSLECLAPSLLSVQTMRAHPTFIAFEQRWQLPVYFQIRWKEIVGELENFLSMPGPDPTHHQGEPHHLRKDVADSFKPRADSFLLKPIASGFLYQHVGVLTFSFDNWPTSSGS